MELLTNTLFFLKIFTLFFTLMVVVRYLSKVYKSINKYTELEVTPMGTIYFAISLSYIFTYIVTLFR